MNLETAMSKYLRNNILSWWLHASENPSSILCVFSGHICTYFYHNPFSGIVYSIMSNKTLPCHTICTDQNHYTCRSSERVKMNIH